MIALFLKRWVGEVKVTKAGNWQGGKEVIALFLKRWGGEIKVTGEALLLKQRVEGFEITNEIDRAERSGWLE